MDVFFDAAWPVLYEDNHLLGLYKPAGLLVQGDDTGDPCLLDLARYWIKRRYDKPGSVYLGLVHRLDRPVAGAILFARTSKAAGRLSRQFREGTTAKHYLAVIHGRPAPDAGELIHHLVRDGRNSRIVPSAVHGSQRARLTYQCLDFRDDRSLVAIALDTGRRHQIRVQFAGIGHPIVGDLRYGKGPALENRQIALFSQKLVVEHPTQKTPLSIEAPIPAGWPWPGLVDPATAPPWEWQRVATGVNGALPHCGPAPSSPIDTA